MYNNDLIEKMKNKQVLRRQLYHMIDLDLHNSTAIEGNQLSQVEVSVFINDGITLHGKRFADYVEVHDYNKALEWLKNNIHNKELKLSSLLVKKIHSMVTGGTWVKNEDEFGYHDERNFSGKYRDDSVFLSTTTYIPPDYEDVPELLEKSIEKYYKRLDEGYSLFESATLFHREMERIHPFFDGNGRTGRVLLNLLLLQDGYPYLTIDLQHRDKYFQSLEDDTFTDFAAGVMIDSYGKYLDQSISEVKAFDTPHS